ncbi:unnamed protein product [Rhizopus microsporus]
MSSNLPHSPPSNPVIQNVQISDYEQNSVGLAKGDAFHQYHNLARGIHIRVRPSGSMYFTKGSESTIRFTISPTKFLISLGKTWQRPVTYVQVDVLMEICMGASGFQERNTR